MDYENRYWEIGEKNKYGNECYKLHFTEFYDDKVIVAFVKDDKYNNLFIITSELMDIEYDYIFCETVEEAKEECEQMVLDFWQDKIEGYVHCIEQFNERRHK